MQVWLPDSRAVGFAEESVRQARLVHDAQTGGDQDDEAWSAALAETGRMA